MMSPSGSKQVLNFGIVTYALLLVAGVSMLPIFPLYLGVQKSPDCRVFDLVIKLDKLLLGCLVLQALGFKKYLGFRGAFASASWRLPGLVVGCAGFLMAAALSAHLVRWDPGLPPFWWQWAAINLVLVCFGEEAFFRLFLLEGFQSQRFLRMSRGTGLALSALLFGLAHFRGGLAYALLAGVAGIFYGLAYRWSGLWGSIGVHFLVNFIHFAGFSYPLLK